ncbi:MAG: hypothetical protein WCK47_02920 [bacterium]|nr:hypothetical protein [Candidatus Sumerlaeota bacterium]
MHKDRISEAVNLAIHNISNIFDEAHGGVPYFGVATLASRPHFYHADVFDLPHLSGRALDALLMAEGTMGAQIDPRVVDRYRQHLFESCKGGDHLNGYPDPNRGGRKSVIMHNLREGLAGLRALVKWREDAKARELADKMIMRLSELLNPDGGWNEAMIAGCPDIMPVGVTHDRYLVSTSGRLIGSLVKYYQTTGSFLALDLASRIKNKILVSCFNSDGTASAGAGWHVHSITSTISSLAQLAESLNDTRLMERVRQLYDTSFGTLITRMGWSKENLSNNLDVGEINNTGDIIQTALILARWGRTGYYDDVDMMLRSHIFPSQLTDVSWIAQTPDPCGDSESRVGGRSLGAFGFPAPYGHKANGVEHLNFNFDITCGAIQALCETARNLFVRKADADYINLFVDCDTNGIEMGSWLPEEGKITVKAGSSRKIAIRLRPWIARDEITVTRNGAAIATVVNADCLFLTPSDGSNQFVIEFPLREIETEEMVNSRLLRMIWCGGQVVQMQPSGDFLPFFEMAEVKEPTA